MFTFTSKGGWDNSERWLKDILDDDFSDLAEYGRMGVEALRSTTPVESGTTAASWGYEISRTGKGVSIDFTNSHINDGVNIAIILQYGHGTGTGGYVAGRDYINPAIQPVFDQIAEEAWRAMTNG